jgi:hypothetical protein
VPRRILLTGVLLLLLWLGLTFFHRSTAPLNSSDKPNEPIEATASQAENPAPDQALPGDVLLTEYASPETPPIDDLKKLHNVLSGYFSVVKDLTRFPIGGNEDLAACLLGENINRQPFIRPNHPILNEDRMLIDRWGTPFSIHPEAARDLTIRSAGPDTEMFTEDDLIILPTGLTP